LATEADKEKFCDFLKGVEDDRLYLADFLTRKALDVGEEVIKKLGGNSNFGKFINDNLLELSVADTETKIKFLLNFRCNYKKMILCNRRFSDNPEYRNIYNAYKSKSNAEIAQFDQLMSEMNSKCLILCEELQPQPKRSYTTPAKVIWIQRE